jgi:hypothetical protein
MVTLPAAAGDFYRQGRGPRLSIVWDGTTVFIVVDTPWVIFEASSVMKDCGLVAAHFSESDGQPPLGLSAATQSAA